MESEAEKLEFSYKYPFSKAAMEIIGSASSKIEEKYLRLGKLRLEEDLSRRRPEFTTVKLNEIKRSIVVSYVYSRMLASALSDRYLLNVYINAESNRVRSALSSEETNNVMELSKELGTSPLSLMMHCLLSPLQLLRTDTCTRIQASLPQIP